MLCCVQYFVINQILFSISCPKKSSSLSSNYSVCMVLCKFLFIISSFGNIYNNRIENQFKGQGLDICCQYSSAIHRSLRRWMVSHDNRLRRAIEYHRCTHCWAPTNTIRWFDWCRIQHCLVVDASCGQFDSMEWCRNLVEHGWLDRSFRVWSTRTSRFRSLAPNRDDLRNPWNRTNGQQSKCMEHRSGEWCRRPICSFLLFGLQRGPCNIHGTSYGRPTNRPYDLSIQVHGCSRTYFCHKIGIVLDLIFEDERRKKEELLQRYKFNLYKYESKIKLFGEKLRFYHRWQMSWYRTSRHMRIIICMKYTYFSCYAIVLLLLSCIATRRRRDISLFRPTKTHSLGFKNYIRCFSHRVQYSYNI